MPSRARAQCTFPSAASALRRFTTATRCRPGRWAMARRSSRSAPRRCSSAPAAGSRFLPAATSSSPLAEGTLMKQAHASGTPAFDAVTLEILWRRAISAVDEAAKALARTSFSTLVNESNDFACVLTDAKGRLLAQNSESIPSFIGPLPVTVKHFSDLTVAKPLSRNGRIVAFAASPAHAPDIGGKVRSVEPREVFEEGFHIPIMKL